LQYNDINKQKVNNLEYSLVNLFSYFFREKLSLQLPKNGQNKRASKQTGSLSVPDLISQLTVH